MLRNLKFLFLAAASTTQQQCTVQTKEEFTTSSIKHYCENTQVTANNKPADIRVGVVNNAVEPISCLSDNNLFDNTKCRLDTQLWVNYAKEMEINTKLDTHRGYSIKIIKAWQDKIIPTYNELASSLSPNQLKNASLLLQQLNSLKNYFINHEFVMSENFGNCGEQTAFSAINLLKLVQEKDLDLRIHYISLRDSTKMRGLIDHSFLLLNSSADPIDIQRDKAKTKNYLKSLKMKSGDICDSWNNGLFAPLKKDTSGVYDHNGPWDTVRVRQVHFDFNMLKSMPIPMQQFFCNELAEINLSEESTKTCETSLSARP